MQLLGGDIVRLPRELLEHAEPLASHAKTGVGQPLHQARLTRIAHEPYASSR